MFNLTRHHYDLRFTNLIQQVDSKMNVCTFTIRLNDVAVKKCFSILFRC